MVTKPDPAKKAEKLKKTIEILTKKISNRQKQAKEPSGDEGLRRLRKGLKRAQRRMVELTPLSLDDQLKKSETLLEAIGKQQDVLKKQGKKAFDPYMHSLGKRAKGLNKRIRKVKRVQEKIKKIEEKKAKAAAPKEPPPAAPPPATT